MPVTTYNPKPSILGYNERVAHSLPYLEILKGWKKGNIFTTQHKMAQELQTSLLINQKRTL